MMTSRNMSGCKAELKVSQLKSQVTRLAYNVVLFILINYVNWFKKRRVVLIYRVGVCR